MRGVQSAEALNSLGVGLAQQGRIEEAFGHFERALDVDPGHVDARLNAARILAAHDYRLDAVQLLLRGFKTRGSDARLRAALAGALEGYPLESAGPEVRAVLLDLANDETIATQALADAIVGLLKAVPGYPAAAVLIEDPLLAALLHRGVVNDESLERALTELRRNVLLGRIAAPLPFLCALAQQCFNNEYAWFVTPEEVVPPPAADERALALATMSQPLNRLKDIQQPANACAAFRDPLARAGASLAYAIRMAKARFTTTAGDQALFDLAAWDRFEASHPAVFPGCSTSVARGANE